MIGNLHSQEELNLRQKLSNKTWYVIKVFQKQFESSISTDFSIGDDKPYLFSLSSRDHTLKQTTSVNGYRFPTLTISSSGELYYYKAKPDSTSEKVTYIIHFASEDLLDIEDEKGNQYFMISDHQAN